MKTNEEANAEIKTDVNSDMGNPSYKRINNRNLQNVHPIDCACPIHEERVGKKEQTLESDFNKREELEYPL